MRFSRVCVNTSLTKKIMSLLTKLYYFPRMIACSVMQYKTKDAPFVENSLTGKTAFITGGNSGIGLETAKSLALQGCEIFILCRNPAKAATAIEEIRKECEVKGLPSRCQALALDLADLESVKRCVIEIRKLNKKIDLFFCNGGIMGQPYSQSPQGYEIHFATNHLGHFALVGSLLDLFRHNQTRIIVVTGDIAVWAKDATPDYVYNDDGIDAYCRSKICNQSFARLLHQRYPELTVYVIHPGVVDSHLFSLPEESFLHRIELAIRPFIMIDCKKGAQTSLLCALTDEYPNGSYVHNVFGLSDYHDTAANEKWSQKLWDLSVQLCQKNGLSLQF